MPIRHPLVPFTEIQLNALTGSMLGDGHLCLGAHNINAELKIARCVKDRDYLQYEADIFHNFVPPRHKGGIVCSSIICEDGTLDEGCSFGTIAAPAFTPIHKLWYPSGKKIVPNSLKLNGQIIAHWICDDGSVDYNKLPYRLRCEFATHGFAKEEVQFLGKLLSDRYNEEFLVRPKYRGDKTYYIIRAYDSACRVMFLDIDPYFKMDRKRIWDKPESRFWADQPERQRSMTKSFKARKEIISKLVEKGESITLIKLAHDLGNVYNGKVDYKSVNKLLKPYIDEGCIVKDVDNMNNNTTTIRIIK
jgi:hypothetical protein